MLKHQAASGVKWSGISQLGRQGLQVLTIVILARLIPPSDFGLIGMAMVIIGFIDIFKDMGTSAAIIQKKDLGDAILSSIFWANVAFGILAMMALFFAAPLVGMFYHEPQVVPVLRVLSASYFISGLSILQQALLERSMDFNLLARVEISATVSGATVGIGLALIGAGVWSLVLQSIITISVTTILLWMLNAWRPQRYFAWEHIKAISGFSVNLVGFNVLNYFARNADYILIGRFLGAQDLGYYTLAYRILLFPIQSISNVIRRVMFPFYSRIQDDNLRFANAYLKTAATIALVSFPMMMGILALAGPFVLVVFGKNWAPVIPVIMILAPVGMTQSVGTLVGTIYQTKGRTDWMFRWGMVSGTFVVIAFVTGLRWGIIGVASAYAVATFSLTYFNHTIPFRLIDLRFATFIRAISRPFVNSLTMFFAIVIFRYLLPGEVPNQWILGLSIALGCAVYGIANWLNNRMHIKELWELAWNKGAIV